MLVEGHPACEVHLVELLFHIVKCNSFPALVAQTERLEEAP